NNATALDGTRDARGKPDLAEIAELLRTRGASDDVPKLDRIEVRRPSARFREVVFRKGTNDWNRFSLLELVAVHYRFLNTSLSGSLRNESGMHDSLWGRELRFPDFKHVVIHRPAGSGWKEVSADVAAILNSGDCSRDVWLEWGDVVEIPETDHPINESWLG